MRTMKLQIETITGGKFEISVLPEDTIESVKAKISRIEGIPISQQQLIHDDKELNDEKLVSDYPNLIPKAKLRLMVAMRGGPINTRRITLDENTSLARDMADYLETHEELLESRLTGSRHPVTLVVFRDGDQFSFFRVVDKTDGTLSPYSSDSLSATSGIADDQDTTESIKLDDENETTKEKVKQLRSQMEQLNIGKSKMPKTIPKPPSSTSTNIRAKLRSMKHSTNSLSSNTRRHQHTGMYSRNNSNMCLPPLMHVNVSPDHFLSESKPTSSMSVRDGAEGIPPPRSVLEAVREEKKMSSGSAHGRRTSTSIYLESLSHTEARGLLRQASIEPSIDKLVSSSIASINFAPAPPSAKLSSSFSRHTPEKRLLSSRLRAYSATNNGRLLSPQSHHLPPVKQKKKTKRCFVCTKKLGLANSFQCKCNNHFCSTHRYAESHSCAFDYKNEGRKLLEKNNPLVRAPKLPKI